MQRVCIVGTPGGGKSWLAAQLGTITGLPVVHLDREFWRPGWVRPDPDAWRARVATLLAGDRWILDGNYNRSQDRVMARADTIVVLDPPRWQAVAGVVARCIRSGPRGRHRADLPDGCAERLDLAFLAWIWRFPAQHRGELLARVARHRAGRPELSVHVLRDRAATRAWLASLR